jgi:hypothetical protein
MRSIEAGHALGIRTVFGLNSHNARCKAFNAGDHEAAARVWMRNQTRGVEKYRQQASAGDQLVTMFTIFPGAMTTLAMVLPEM